MFKVLFFFPPLQEKLALLVKCMWLKISTLEEINPKNIAFKEWTWEAIGM